MKEIIKQLIKWLIVVALIVVTKYLDAYTSQGISEMLWLVCGYLGCWILD